MKKLNLILISVLFSSLLVGCGMKGPLYRVPEPQTIEEPEQQIEPVQDEQHAETPEENAT